VWVWGFWFGFALRCLALLCSVFVRLHLVLFLAGGPFLPSLSVRHSIIRFSIRPVPYATLSGYRATRLVIERMPGRRHASAEEKNMNKSNISKLFLACGGEQS
jgi:hypothetical protein